MRTHSLAVLYICTFAALPLAGTGYAGASSLEDPSASQSAEQKQGSQSADQKQGKKRKASGIGSDCTPNKRLPPFSMDATGNVSAKGRSIEGPVCIEVDYDPLQYRVSISSVETQSKGPDASSVLLGSKSVSGGIGSARALEDRRKANQLSKTQLSQAFKQLEDDYDGIFKELQGEKTSYNAAITAQSTTISDIKWLLNALAGKPLPAQAATITNEYNATISIDFGNAESAVDKFIPADQTPKQSSDPNTPPESLLQRLNNISHALDRLGVTYGAGDTLPANTKIACTEDTVVGGTTYKVSWRDWYGDALCKQLFDNLKQAITDAATSMQPYTNNTDNITALRAKVAIVGYWKKRFADIGAVPGKVTVDFSQSGVVKDQEPCGNIFNQNASRAISLVTVDETPTLDGNAPTVKTQDPFLTVTCASPIALSAGVEFSSIRQKEFAIVKSAGSTPGGPSVAKFGTLSDSAFHPMPAAYVHARLKESAGHMVGLHATLGVSGNIQGQDSGGSSAEFLTGFSLALWRTIYISAGAHIGTRPELAGGFHEGDLVPSDITTIQGQVKRSYTAGFGFAFSFGKP